MLCAERVIFKSFSYILYLEVKNKMKIEFLSKSENEALARVAVAAFASQLDPNLEEISDIKTAVSEGVTNAIIHGYGHDRGTVFLECTLLEDELVVKIKDEGRGIEDIKQAVTPLFTTSPEEERSGMGFSVMESFMDAIEIESAPGKGTCIMMKKYIGRQETA